MTGYRTPEYNDLYDYADRCASEGRHGEALEIYEKLSQINPGDDSLLLSIAWVHRDSGNIEKALQYLEQILEKELSRKVFTGFAYDELVRFYRETGEDEKLIFLCERAASAYPNDPSLLATLGKACLRSGKADRAFQVFSILVGFDPEAPVYHMDLASAAVLSGRFDQAEKACEEACRLDPDDAHMYFDRLSTTYLEAGQYDKAERASKRSIEICPKNPLYYCSLGEIHLKRGRLDDSRKAFEEACRIDPFSRSAFHNRLANSMLRQGHTIEAIDEYEKAVAADPRNPFYYLSIIGCCEALGDTERAERFRNLGLSEGVLSHEK
ncbi:MAG: tetratricopeptide repeat protein [Syntrophales bacterium]|nr:tetratricopeptide repeat protein [Syntrophales bacterium]